MPYKDPEKRRENNRRWAAANPERKRENNRRWAAANPEKLREAGRRHAAAHPEQGRRWKEANPEKVKETKQRWVMANPEKVHVKDRRATVRQYGITLEQYDAMLAAQDYRCALCGLDAWANDAGRRLAVDHCHKTGKVRALLCDTCNRGLGHFRDNPTLLQAAINYIEFHQDDWCAP
jgi:hypothetical protein